MKKLKIFLTYISSNRVWIITLACLDVFFIFLAWLANPDYFINYVALIIFVSFAALAIPLAISIRKRNKTDAIFRRFLLEPDDTNEYLLCEAVPAVLRPYICELGQHLRTQQEYINEQKITVTDYEHYIENWVHEIKKPLSLMTLLLDNRKDEMSPLVHTRMAWTRAVCGRLKSDYSYSNTIVYNNFPWPSPTKAILNARALYPDSNLADLYDPLTMPTELLKAHNANNRAVMDAYGFSIKMSEADCVAELMRMYQKLTKEK